MSLGAKMVDFMKMLTKGEGTPWGATETSQPTTPSYITDPNSVTTSFDYSPLAASYKKAFLDRQGTAKNQLLASMAKSGTLSSSGTKTGLTDLAAQTESGLADIDAQMDLKAWQDRVDQMDRLNKIKQAEYQTNKEAYDAEQSGRAGALKGLFTGGIAVSDAVGKYFGNKNAS